MPLLFFCKDDDQQTPRGRGALGSSKAQKFVAGLGALPHAGESNNGPASQATSTSLGSSPLPLDSCRQDDDEVWGQEQAKRPVGRSPMRPDGSSGRRWCWWGCMTRVPGWAWSWLGWAACLFQPCVSHQARAEPGGSGQDRTLAASSRPQSPPEDAGFTVLAGPLGASCRYRIAPWSPVFFSKITPVGAECGNTVLCPGPSTFAQSPQLGR
ncbi:hypothetical protein CHU98_g6606 [Xylaria longipes]|nr:hypothetical protein CHU98_g6606 [Xylaria longipes]